MIKKLKFFLTVALVPYFLGCASTNTKKTFKVNAEWVQDTLSAKNIGFRKINRMSLVRYADFIIAGNSLDGIVAYHVQSRNVA